MNAILGALRTDIDVTSNACKRVRDSYLKTKRTLRHLIITFPNEVFTPDLHRQIFINLFEFTFSDLVGDASLELFLYFHRGPTNHATSERLVPDVTGRTRWRR